MTPPRQVGNHSITCHPRPAHPSDGRNQVCACKCSSTACGVGPVGPRGDASGSGPPGRQACQLPAAENSSRRAKPSHALAVGRGVALRGRTADWTSAPTGPGRTSYSGVGTAGTHELRAHARKGLIAFESLIPAKEGKAALRGAAGAEGPAARPALRRPCIYMAGHAKRRRPSHTPGPARWKKARVRGPPGAASPQFGELCEGCERCERYGAPAERAVYAAAGQVQAQRLPEAAARTALMLHETGVIYSRFEPRSAPARPRPRHAR